MSDKTVSTNAETASNDEIVTTEVILSFLRSSPFPYDLDTADLIERQRARMAVLESVTRELLSYVEADYVGSRGKDYSNGAIDRARAALEGKG